MHPVLVRFNGFAIHTYGVLVALGVLLGLWLARRRAAAAGLPADRVWNLGIYMVLAALVGAKLWLVVSSWDYYRASPREIFSLRTLQSGGVFYGGFLAALAVGYFYARRHRLGFFSLADVYAAPLALGHAIGRLGCFAAGCCWGRATDFFCAVTFTDPQAAQGVGTPLSVPLHPVQLYEAAANFVIFGVLLFLGRAPRPAGALFGAYALLYGVARGVMEFFRDDPYRTMLFGTGYSVMQLVSLGLVALGLWLLLGRRPAAA